MKRSRSSDLVADLAFPATWEGTTSAADVIKSSATDPRLPRSSSANSGMLVALLGDSGGELVNSQTPDPASASSIPTEYYPVSSWDRYEFLGVLGHGGMGSVYQARDRRILRIVALKFVSGQNERLKQRFLQEARAQSRIDHPGICKVLEVGEVEGRAFIAMQFIDGQPLERAHASMTLREKIQVIKDTAEALHAAHELGIIHRDVKPSNIMVEALPGGGYRPILMDFGLARDTNSDLGLTESGVVMGTPWYMSPEQTRGEVKTLDRRTDVYSLGATLYELLAGRPPDLTSDKTDTLLQGLRLAPMSIIEHVPTLPPALDIIVSKCLSAEVGQRFPTAQALAEDLDRFLNDKPIVAKKLSLAYRLGFFVRRNKLLALSAGALLVSLLVLLGYGIRNRIQVLEKERAAKAQAALAHRLGQAVGELDWLARVTYAMPLHDTSYELAVVRRRMTELERELRSYGEIATGLAGYALGRGHLALHEWQPAYEYLLKAQASGFSDPELDYALGRVMGELYSEGVEAARRSGDASFIMQRRKELEATYLVPALSHLEKARQLDTISTSYVEGLIEFYQTNYDAALVHAQRAQRTTTWLYEASKLEGDIHLARALNDKDHGSYEQAEHNFQLALKNYERASDLGRSDYQLYEAIAEVVIRQMELDGLRGQDPRARLTQALTAADRSIVADHESSNGYAKKAFAYLFVVYQLESLGLSEEVNTMTEQLIMNGKKAVDLHPRDTFSRDVLGNGYIYLAKYLAQKYKAYQGELAMAKDEINAAIVENPRFPWAYNDLGRTYLLEGDDLLARRKDPMAAYRLAIEAFEKAIRIDAGYLNGYANIALTYSSMAQYCVEMGRDPGKYVDRSIEFAQKTLDINSRFDLAYGAIIYSLLMESQYNLDAGRDAITSAGKAQRIIEKFAKIQPKFGKIYQHLALTHYIIAKQQASKEQDPDGALLSGLSAVATCQKMSEEGSDGTCSSLEALLLTFQAERQRRQGLSPQSKLEQALAKAKQARELSPSDTDVLLAAAEVYFRVAGLSLATPAEAGKAVDEGLTVINAALLLAPGWPRGLAMQGALYGLKARIQKEGLLRQESLALSQTARSRAEAGNPLLKNAYRIEASAAMGSH